MFSILLRGSGHSAATCDPVLDDWPPGQAGKLDENVYRSNFYLDTGVRRAAYTSGGGGKLDREVRRNYCWELDKWKMHSIIVTTCRKNGGPHASRSYSVFLSSDFFPPLPFVYLSSARLLALVAIIVSAYCRSELLSGTGSQAASMEL